MSNNAIDHVASPDDELFRREFETFRIPPGDFNHRAHVRLAYIYLCENAPEQAALMMRRSLLAFLTHLGVGTAKFHETLTHAWIKAVHHFMKHSRHCSCFEEFIAKNERLLEPKIMLSHYSADVLFSEAARANFAEPDIAPIPG